MMIFGDIGDSGRTILLTGPAGTGAFHPRGALPDGAVWRAIRIADADTGCPGISIADCISDPHRHGAETMRWSGRQHLGLGGQDALLMAHHDPLAPVPEVASPGRDATGIAWQAVAVNEEAEAEMVASLRSGNTGATQRLLFGECTDPDLALAPDALAVALSRAGLDPEAGLAGFRAFSACPGDADPSACRWYSAPGDTGFDRRQAAGASPLLAGTIARNPTVRAAVEERRSLNEALRRVYPNLGKGGLKRLGRIRTGTADQMAMGEAFGGTDDADAINTVRERRLPLGGRWQVAEAIRWLDGAARSSGGIDIVPDNAKDWHAFSNIWSGMIMPMAAHFDCVMLEMRPQNGQWHRLLEGLQSDLGLASLPDRRVLNVAVVDAADLADRLAGDIILPVALSEISKRRDTPHPTGDWLGEIRMQARQAALNMLIPPNSKQLLRACATTVRRGLTRLTALETARAGEAEGTASDALHGRYACEQAWEPPWEDWSSPDGSAVSWLRTADEMRQEGREMGHCIGRFSSYRNSCRMAAAIACRITGPGGERATAYLRLGDSDRPRPSEMHGRRNRPAPPACARAMTGFLEAERAGSVPRRAERADYLDWVHSPEGQATVATGGEGKPSVWTRLCGRRVTGPEAGQRTVELWDIWKEVLPGASRASVPEQAVWCQPVSGQLLKNLSPPTWEEMAGVIRRNKPQAALEAAP